MAVEKLWFLKQKEVMGQLCSTPGSPCPSVTKLVLRATRKVILWPQSWAESVDEGGRRDRRCPS